MKKAAIILGIALAVVIGVVIGYMMTPRHQQYYYPPPQTTPSESEAPEPTPAPTPIPEITTQPEAPLNEEEVVGTLHNHQLAGGYWHHWNKYIKEGTQVTISWEADGPMSVFILTETQYEYFKVYGFNPRYIAYKRSNNGALIETLPYSDTYFIVIKNSSTFDTFKIYSAEVKLLR